MKLASNSYTIFGKQHELISSLYRLTIGPQDHVAYHVQRDASGEASIPCGILGIQSGKIVLAVDLCPNPNASRHRLHQCILVDFAGQQMLLGTTYQSRICVAEFGLANLILSALGTAIVVLRNCTFSCQRRRKVFNFRARTSIQTPRSFTFR